MSILIERTKTMGWEAAIRGMRNPMNSWGRSDSFICKGVVNDESKCVTCPYVANSTWHCHNYYGEEVYVVGANDLDLMKRLVHGGPVHSKYLRFIVVSVDITAPLYWWKEFDTYRTGVTPNPMDIEMNSCSTMHKLMSKEFDMDDFSNDQLCIIDATDLKDALPKDSPGLIDGRFELENTIATLNALRNIYLVAEDPSFKKAVWYQIIQLLPSSYMQKRTVQMSYETLNSIYKWRHMHKQYEWRELCAWIAKLPYAAELIVPE